MLTKWHYQFPCAAMTFKLNILDVMLDTIQCFVIWISIFYIYDLGSQRGWNLGIISKTSKYGVNAANSSCPLLFLFLLYLSVNWRQRITQQDYGEWLSIMYFVYLYLYFYFNDYFSRVFFLSTGCSFPTCNFSSFSP